MKSKKKTYTVNNVPWFYKPFYWIYGYSIGLFMIVTVWFIHATLRVEKEFSKEIDQNDNFIYCLWHHYLFCFYMSIGDFRDFEMIGHPAWFMKPVHVLNKWIGFNKIYYGSTGNSGREALDALTEGVTNGKYTFLNPDGPFGPVYKFNKGVLHLSKNTQKPIVPIEFSISRSFRFTGWDRKFVPIPFSKVTIKYGDPIYVTAENFEAMEAHIKEVMIPK